ncbi:LIV-I protein H [Variovorax sp. PBL-H6]|uniref:branched-chain amino acid ABC transporter permease n=1 Tax=Variovorax sp. PBL-H6 TaxID=434009 RepID=UPI0013179ADA|nr:branched-chain amino acid ABC transporter permease [Variovorax sp. PBL-H6]VTU26686.1 LIV-I protein H [Variovorax sp. PBL-H6]
MTAQLLPILLDSVNYMAVLLLVSIGLVLIFGLMQVINLAHGEFFLIGAYGLWWSQNAGLPFAAGVLVGAMLAGLVGLLAEVTVISRMYQRPLDTILATWGLSIAIKQAIVIAFGPQSQQIAAPLTSAVSVFGVSYSSYRLLVIAVAVVVALLVFTLLYRTRLGLAARAAMVNRAMARSIGIDARRIDRAAFSLGTALAGLAGAVMAPLMSVDPQMGFGFVLPAFLSILVGGVGSPLGALWGTGLLGGSQTVMASFWSPVIAQIAVFTIAIAIIRLYPSGITGLRR